MIDRPPSHPAAPDRGVQTNELDARTAPAWYWWGLGAVTVASLFLCAWELSRNGMGNGYYTAAVLSGTQSWKAAFFGSLDTGLFLTVDKPAPALWPDMLSVRLFDLSSWSLLLPYTLAGVASVALLADSVRRIWGPQAALLAAIVLATTPVAVAVNRSNLPEPLLVLSLVAAAWALVRGLESGRTAWIVAAMAFVGLGFNAKLLQAWIVLPALGLTWLFFAPGSRQRRIAQGFAAVATVLVASFWWAVIVDYAWWGDKPHIGGSSDGSVMSLIFSYAGLDRVFGGNSNPAAAFFDGGPGPLRMFNDENGGQIAWLLPLVTVCLVALAVQAGRDRDRLRLGATMLWGLWLAAHVVVFSSAKGIYHPYYTAALAPANAALAGAGGIVLWERRDTWIARIASAVGIVTSGALAFALLDRVSFWQPWLGPTALALSLVAATFIVGVAALARLSSGVRTPATLAVATFVAVAVLLPSAYYATTPISFPRPLPHAGPDEMRVSPAVAQLVTPNQTSPELLSYLRNEWEGERWVVATLGSFVGADLIIDLDGAPVMVMGGFSGLDDGVPTLDQFLQHLDAGDLRFVLVPDRSRLPPPVLPGAGDDSLPPPSKDIIEALLQIAERHKWVAGNCALVDRATFGGPDLNSLLYDCAGRPMAVSATQQ